MRYPRPYLATSVQFKLEVSALTGLTREGGAVGVFFAGSK